jgi:hypothetical protein
MRHPGTRERLAGFLNAGVQIGNEGLPHSAQSITGFGVQYLLFASAKPARGILGLG